MYECDAWFHDSVGGAETYAVLNLRDALFERRVRNDGGVGHEQQFVVGGDFHGRNV